MMKDFGIALTIVGIIGVILIAGTFSGTALWLFWDTVVKFVPMDINPTWWECVRFGWVTSALFKSSVSVGNNKGN